MSVLRRVSVLSIIVLALILSACDFPPPGSSATPTPPPFASVDFPTGPGAVDAYIRAPGTTHSPDFHQADGDEVRNCQGQFIEWHGISNARYFDVQIDDNNDFSSPTVNQSVGTGDFIPPEPSQQFPFENYRTSYTFGTLYYYHVRARNNGGAAPYGPTHSFHWPAPPSIAPALTVPADGAPLGPGGSFHWTYSGPIGDPFTGDCFHIQIGTTPDMASLIWDMDFFAPDRNYALPASAFSSGNTYYWRLAGCNNAGPSVPTCGPWTTIRSFIYQTTGQVHVAIYSDFNHDGDADDPGEGLLSGVTVSINDCGPLQTHVTDASGIAEFINLTPGTCHVSVAKPGWVFDGTFPPGIGSPPAAASDPSLPTAFSIFMKPVSSGPGSVPLATLPPAAVIGPLSFDWSMIGWRLDPNNRNQYFGMFKLVPTGGKPPYQFFFDDQQERGSEFEGPPSPACKGRATTLTVKSSDGQSVSKSEFIFPPPKACPAPTPEPTRGGKP